MSSRWGGAALRGAWEVISSGTWGDIFYLSSYFFFFKPEKKSRLLDP